LGIDAFAKALSHSQHATLRSRSSVPKPAAPLWPAQNVSAVF
jgi:hypothetical protein